MVDDAIFRLAEGSQVNPFSFWVFVYLLALVSAPWWAWLLLAVAVVYELAPRP